MLLKNYLVQYLYYMYYYNTKMNDCQYAFFILLFFLIKKRKSSIYERFRFVFLRIFQVLQLFFEFIFYVDKFIAFKSFCVDERFGGFL